MAQVHCPRCRITSDTDVVDGSTVCPQCQGTWSIVAGSSSGTGTGDGSGDGMGQRDDLIAAADGMMAFPSTAVPDTGGLADERSDRRELPESFPEIPGYEIIRLIGRGGMGRVYLARHRSLNRYAAVKTLRDLDEHFIIRFKEEARALAEIDHPNVARVFEVGSVGGQPYLVLEYLPGGTLSKQRDAGPRQPRDAADTVEKIARGVQACHDRNIIHRDLKPANVLLAADGTPKVSDFGLAKRIGDDQHLTQTGQILGTPAYMAPEQATGVVRRLTPAVDVYSLGVILYEQLTGRPPFQGPDMVQTLAQVVSDDAIPVRKLQPKTPRDLETICARCLEKNPKRRYPSARDLADDLRAFLDHRPIQARPIGVFGRSSRWIRRRPVISALLAALIVSISTGFGLVVWKWQDADRQRQAAEANETAERQAKTRENAQRMRAEAAEKSERIRAERAERDLYARTFVLAAQFHDRGEPLSADRMLQDCAKSDRGWEWRYLQNQLYAERASDRSAEVRVHGVRWADATETTVEYVDWNGTVRLWNSVTGESTVRRTSPDRVVSFSANRQCFAGTAILEHEMTAPKAGDSPADRLKARSLRVVEATDGKLIRRWDANGVIIGMTASADGTVAALAVRTEEPAYEIRVVEPRSGRLFSTIRREGTAPFHVLMRISPDRSTLMWWDGIRQGLAVIADGTVRKDWKTAEGTMTAVNLDIGCFAPDSRSAYWVDPMGMVVRRDVTTGESIRSYPIRHGEPRCAAVSADGKLLAVGAVNGRITLLNADTGADVGTFTGHLGSVAEVQFSRDGRRLVSCGGEGVGGEVKLWDLPAVPAVTPGPPIAPHRTAMDRTGRRLFCAWPDRLEATAASSGTVEWTRRHFVTECAYDPDSDSLILVEDGEAGPRSGGISTDDDRIFRSDRPLQVTVVDVRDGAVRYGPVRLDRRVGGLAVDADRQTFWLGEHDADTNVRLVRRRLKDPAVVVEQIESGRMKVGSLACVDAHSLFVGTIAAIDPQLKRLIPVRLIRVGRPDEGPIRSEEKTINFGLIGNRLPLAVLPEWKMVAVPEQSTIRTFDSQSLTPLATWPSEESVVGIRADTTGNRLYSFGYRRVQVWHPPTGVRLLQLPTTDDPVAVAVSSDGETVSAVGRRGGRSVWQNSRPSSAVRYPQRSGGIARLCYSADGGRVLIDVKKDDNSSDVEVWGDRATAIFKRSTFESDQWSLFVSESAVDGVVTDNARFSVPNVQDAIVPLSDAPSLIGTKVIFERVENNVRRWVAVNSRAAVDEILSDGKVKSLYPAATADRPVSAIWWNRRGTRLAVAETTGGLAFRSLGSTGSAVTGGHRHRVPIAGGAIGNHDTAVSVDLSGQGIVWNVRTGKAGPGFALPSNARVISAAIDETGERAAFALSGMRRVGATNEVWGEVRIIHLGDGKLLRTLYYPQAPMTTVDWHPKTGMLLVGAADGAVWEWPESTDPAPASP